MKTIERLVSIFIFIFILLAVIFSKIDLRYFEDVFVREDGVVEWLTVVALLSGAYISSERLFLLYQERSKEFNFCLLVLAGLFLFGSGEELSWGQRIFALKSPEFFMHHNTQMETNFHNLVLGGVKLNRLIFGTFLGVIVACYFLVLPVLFKKNDKVREICNRLGLPIPRNFHLFLYALLFIGVKLISSGRKGEVLEFGGCWIFLLMILNPKNIEIYKKNY